MDRPAPADQPTAPLIPGRAESTGSTDGPNLDTRAGRLDQPLLRDVTALVEAAEDSDGNPPLSDQTWVELRTTDDPERVHTVLAWLDHQAGRDGELAGAAVVISPAAGEHQGAATLELVVHPHCRGRGVGTALAQAALDRVGEAPLQAWAHGNHSAASRLAERFGAEAGRELYRLRLTHRTDTSAEASSGDTGDTAPRVWDETVPDGVRIRAFEPGTDDAAWVRANAAAFADHPEQGSMTQEDLRARQEEPWFDPAGFLVAEDTTGAEPTMLGFHWTKIHPTQEEHAPLGEVYVVGVVPQAQGRGLGRLLTVAGIRHLQRQGVDAVMLYVDSDNTPAVNLYRALGFTRWDTDVMYVRG